MKKFSLLFFLIVVNTNFIYSQTGILTPTSQIIGDWRNPRFMQIENDFLVVSYAYKDNTYGFSFSKLDLNGNEIWERFTPTGLRRGDDFKLITADNSFYIVGSSSTSYSDIFLSDPKGEEDIYILKFNLEAELEWARRMGGDGKNIVNDAKITPQNNLILAGGYSEYQEGEDFPESNFYIAEISPNNEMLREVVITDYMGELSDYDQMIKSFDVNESGQIYAHGWTNYIYSNNSDGTVTIGAKSVFLKFSAGEELLTSIDIADDYDYYNSVNSFIKFNKDGDLVLVYRDLLTGQNTVQSDLVISKYSTGFEILSSDTLKTNKAESIDNMIILENNSILLTGLSNSNYGGDIMDINTYHEFQPFITIVNAGGEIEWSKFYETNQNNTNIHSLNLAPDNKLYGAVSKPLASLLDDSITYYNKSSIVTFEFEEQNNDITLNENISKTGLTGCGTFLRWNKLENSSANIKYLLKLNNEIAYAGRDTVTVLELVESTDYEIELFAVDNYLNRSNIVTQSFRSPSNVQDNLAGNFVFQSESSTNIYDMEVNSDGSKIMVGASDGETGNELIGEHQGKRDGIIMKLSPTNEIINAISVGGSERDYVSEVVKHNEGYACAVFYDSKDLKINGESREENKGILILNLDNYANIVWEKYMDSASFNGDFYAVRDLQVREDRLVAIMQEGSKFTRYTIDISSGDSNKEVLVSNTGSGNHRYINYIEQGDQNILFYTADNTLIIQKMGAGSVDSIGNTNVFPSRTFFYDSGIELLENGNYLLAFSSDKDSGGAVNQGGYDIFFMEIDSKTGEVISEMSFGGSSYDYVSDFVITSSGKILTSIQSGSAYISDETFINRGESDVFIMNLDWNTKTIVNTEHYGGNGNESLSHIRESSPGIFHLGGYTESTNCDLMLNSKTYRNMWLIDYRDEKDIVPPEAPINLDTLQTNSEDTTLLAWEDAVDNYGVAYYNVYMNDKFIGKRNITNLYELINEDFDRKVYQFKVTAVDYARFESEPAILDLDFSIILSTEDFKHSKFDIKLYPVPTNEKLTIQFSDDIPPNLQFIIFDQYGHKVKSFNRIPISGKSVEINQLDDLKPGVFMLRIVSDKGSITKRIVKF